MGVLEEIRHSRWFDTIYKVGISIKGFDGVIELIAGLILVFSPQTPHYLLTRIADYFADKGTNFFDFIASAVVKLDTGLTGQTTLFVIIFLLSHGLIKVVLVYCLLKKFYRIYPYALVVLILMLFA
jgi:Predicted membrane protein